MRTYIVNLFIAFMSVCILVSCSTHRLTKEDLEWQPYKKGDVLIFKSNKGDEKRIDVTAINKYSNPNDPLDPIADKFQTLFVSGEYYHEEKKDPSGQLYNRSHCDILRIGKGKKDIYLGFELDEVSIDLFKYPSISYSSEEIKSFPNQIFANNKPFTVYKIKGQETADNLKDFERNLEWLYYSKEYGYLKFVYKDGIHFQLIEFRRKGKNIIQVPDLNF